VADVAAETVSLIRPLADQHSIMVVDPHVACSTHVLGDRQRLKQVLLNLLSNAVKYNREGGSVELACAPVADDRLRIAVTDTGLGVPPDALARLFVPFERVGRQSGIEGTGLGLPLSKRLAEEQVEPPGPPLTVLYIEDNMSNLRLVERILGRRPGVR
jgi:signal transduction histidine kinase